MARKPRRKRGTVLTSSGRPWPRVDGPMENDWTVSTTWKSPSGRILTPGTELSIRGERGRFRFVKHVKRPNGVEWIDVWGGRGNVESFRSFRPEAIRRVHRIERTAKNLAKARKEARAKARAEAA